VRTPNILVVDDEPAVLRLMALALARQGWHIYQAKDAVAALATAKGLSCGLNLLITDIDMPGIAGDELIRHIRKMCPLVDVLAISGALPERSNGLSNIPYLQKPFDMMRLAEVSREILSGQLI
jgi:DNA-binding response OmpR family regulator